jgi:hypothetical protein
MPDRIGAEVIEAKGYGEGATKVVIVERLRLGLAASMAWELCSRWGMAAAKPDGEDSAGRQRLAVLTPEEMTERACATSEAMLTEFEKRGWVLEIPAPQLDKESRLDPTVGLESQLRADQLLS